MKIKWDTNDTSGLTHWWVEDVSGGQLLRSPGFTDPAECQRNLDLCRQAFRDYEKEHGNG